MYSILILLMFRLVGKSVGRLVRPKRMPLRLVASPAKNLREYPYLTAAVRLPFMHVSYFPLNAMEREMTRIRCKFCRFRRGFVKDFCTSCPEEAQFRFFFSRSLIIKTD